MGRVDTEEDGSDAFLRALAWTPRVAPFTGTERYRVHACLGEGGFGVVYEVEDRELGQNVALKVLKPQRAGYAEQLQRLKREFRSVADLVHANLVGLHELTSDGARWFFTMELVRGRDFLEHVRGGPDAESRLRAALPQLVAGVAVLHDAGIVHRDLKPSNVLVEPGGRVVILDFGLAHGDGGEPDELAAGTPLFMAPEQFAGRPVTTAADWYAVGVMLYEALTGRIPERDAVVPPSQHVRVPADLEQLCLALLRPDPAERLRFDEIVAHLGDPAIGVSRRRDRRGTFVGRAAELARLRDGHARLVAGEPGVIRIHGQPGVGKSLLLAQFLDEARAAGALVLAGRCHEREAVPYKAFDGVIDALVAHLRALPRGAAAALLPADIGLAVQLFPALETVAGESRRTGAPVDPRAARLASFTALEELLARLGQERPLVIAVDDMQWSDVDSARLFAHLITPPRPRVLFVLAHRTGDSPIVHETLRMLAAAGDRGSELAVGCLPAAEAVQLAAQLLDPTRTAAAATIAERGEGHPLFIVELARAGAGAAEATPSLLDMLWQRVVGLAPSARALLEIIAVAGGPLAARIGYAAAGLGSSGSDAARVLRAEHLIRADAGDVLTVYHDRIRDAVLERGAAADRRDRHLALARCLEAAPAADPEALARHYDAAGEHAHAARHAARAGDAAMATLAFDRAAAMYRLAIARGIPTAELHEKLGGALDAGGYNVAAGEAFLAGADLSSGALATDLARRGAEQLLAISDVERGMRALERAMSAVGERLPTRRGAQLEMIADMVRFRLRRPRFVERERRPILDDQLRRLDVLESAIRGLEPNDPILSIALGGRYCRLAQAVGEPRRAALGLAHAVFHFAASRHDPRIDMLLDEAEAIGARLADPSITARALVARSMLAFAYGDWPATADAARRAARLIAERCIGLANDRRMALFHVAGACAVMGQLQEARRIGDELLLDAIERGDAVIEKNVCGSVLARLALAADELSRARELVGRIAGEDRCPSMFLRCETTAMIAAYDGRAGDGVDAWRARWKELREMGVMQVAGFRAMIVRSLGTALLARGERRDLRETARLAGTIARLDTAYASAVRAQLRALRALVTDQHEAAASALADAAAQFAAAHMPFDAAACRLRRGKLAGDADAVARAEALLRGGGIASPERWTAMVLPR